jgi:hypothetical protein
LSRLFAGLPVRGAKPPEKLSAAGLIPQAGSR